jgi:hypothetical protein
MRQADERVAESWPPHNFVMGVQGVVRSARGVLEALGSADVVPEAAPKPVVAPLVPANGGGFLGYFGMGGSRPAPAPTVPLEKPKPKPPSIDGALSSMVRLCKTAVPFAAR